MTAYRHFSGDYRAWFRISDGQSVHTHTFQNLIPDSIEIRNLSPLENRLADTERVGDFLYFPLLRAKKKSSLLRTFQYGATDIVILADESRAFSEDLEEVVLSGQAGERTAPGSQIRKARFERIAPDFIQLSGRITFSVPAEPLKVLPDTSPEMVPASGTTVSAGPTFVRSPEIPDLLMQPEVQTASGITRRAGGCWLSLWQMMKWAFYMVLFLIFLGWIGVWLRERGEAGLVESGEGQIETGKPRLNPRQDTLVPMPWDYLTDHRIQWYDFIRHSFLAKYSTSSRQFEDSRRMHQPFANPQVSEAMAYWHAVYAEFSGRDMPKLDSLVEYFRAEKKSKNLNSLQTAEMVVTFIQEIPYCLVHEGSCREASALTPFVRDYHAAGKPCLPDIIAGVQSPYEFLHNLKGDCDTRSLLGFSVLTRMGIPASVWVSEAYGHSVLGLGLGSGGTYFKSVGGIRHTPVELTAKGFRAGMISPEHGDMNNWNIALFKN